MVPFTYYIGVFDYILPLETLKFSFYTHRFYDRVKLEILTIKRFKYVVQFDAGFKGRYLQFVQQSKIQFKNKNYTGLSYRTYWP